MTIKSKSWTPIQKIRINLFNFSGETLMTYAHIYFRFWPYDFHEKVVVLLDN